MIPIKQTINHDPKNGKIGNCFQACVASILELPIDDVPHFALMGDDEWWQGVQDWFNTRDYWALYIEVEYPPLSNLKGYSIACGISQRGIYHACVAWDGEVVFDPHPNDDGLKEIEAYCIFVKIIK